MKRPTRARRIGAAIVAAGLLGTAIPATTLHALEPTDARAIHANADDR